MSQIVWRDTLRDILYKAYFLFQPKFEKNGKKYRKIEYVSDFRYYDIRKKKTVVEDTKGHLTNIYKMKRKMFEYVYQGLEILET